MVASVAVAHGKLVSQVRELIELQTANRSSAALPAGTGPLELPPVEVPPEILTIDELPPVEVPPEILTIDELPPVEVPPEILTIDELPPVEVPPEILTIDEIPPLDPASLIKKIRDLGVGEQFIATMFAFLNALPGYVDEQVESIQRQVREIGETVMQIAEGVQNLHWLQGLLDGAMYDLSWEDAIKTPLPQPAAIYPAPPPADSDASCAPQIVAEGAIYTRKPSRAWHMEINGDYAQVLRHAPTYRVKPNGTVEACPTPRMSTNVVSDLEIDSNYGAVMSNTRSLDTGNSGLVVLSAAGHRASAYTEGVVGISGVEFDPFPTIHNYFFSNIRLQNAISIKGEPAEYEYWTSSWTDGCIRYHPESLTTCSLDRGRR